MKNVDMFPRVVKSVEKPHLRVLPVSVIDIEAQKKILSGMKDFYGKREVVSI